MIKKLNTTEKKLKFHCSNCSATWQLFIIQTKLISCKDTKCLNNCLDKWQTLLIEYCKEQIILDFAKKEQKKDREADQLTDWINQIKKNSQQ